MGAFYLYTVNAKANAKVAQAFTLPQFEQHGLPLYTTLFTHGEVTAFI